MGSSISHPTILWVLLAIICGVCYLIFDALRSFALQLSPVRMRTYFEAEDFQLLSGALLQISLAIGVGAMTMVFDEDTIGGAVLRSVAIWTAIVLVWKFLLALVPDDIGETILRTLIPFARGAYYFFWPFLFPLRRLLARVDAAQNRDDEDEDITQEEVQAYIDVGEEEGIIEASEGKMLQSLVEFGDRLAHEIMTPRIDVLAFDARRPIGELATLFSESKYARIPIYEQSIDQITGIVHIKDLFDAILKNEQRSVAELARPPYFVSETKKVSDLLRELQSEHLQIAVVVDEYGGTAGIITTEDVVEEIVGEIADEHEDEEATVVDVGNDTWLVSGMLRVEMLEEKFGLDLSGDDYETVAGLILHTLGRLPAVGTEVRTKGLIFKVERADRRRIYRVKVTRDPEWQREEEEEEA